MCPIPGAGLSPTAVAGTRVYDAPRVAAAAAAACAAATAFFAPQVFASASALGFVVGMPALAAGLLARHAPVLSDGFHRWRRDARRQKAAAGVGATRAQSGQVRTAVPEGYLV